MTPSGIERGYVKFKKMGQLHLSKLNSRWIEEQLNFGVGQNTSRNKKCTISVININLIYY
jgi:hypothetical protein